MADDGANASTFTFAGSAQAVTSITYSDNAAAVDVTNMSDSTHVYVAGRSDPELTCECVGASSLAIGCSGSIAIAWNDGKTNSVASVVLTSFENTGGLDGAITSTLTFKPKG